MYRIIRCGTGFNPVIMVSPPDADQDTPDAKYYCYEWQIKDLGKHQSGMFNEISKNEAISYFSGLADGMGYEEPPADIFPSLEAAFQYVFEKQNKYGRKRLKERGIDPDMTDEEFRIMMAKELGELLRD